MVALLRDLMTLCGVGDIAIGDGWAKWLGYVWSPERPFYLQILLWPMAILLLILFIPMIAGFGFMALPAIVLVGSAHAQIRWLGWESWLLRKKEQSRVTVVLKMVSFFLIGLLGLGFVLLERYLLAAATFFTGTSLFVHAFLVEEGE